MFTDSLKFEKAPDPLEIGAGGLAACSISCFPFLLSLYSFQSMELHNRWGVVETPLPVKTQSRNMDRSLSAQQGVFGWLQPKTRGAGSHMLTGESKRRCRVRAKRTLLCDTSP